MFTPKGKRHINDGWKIHAPAFVYRQIDIDDRPGRCAPGNVLQFRTITSQWQNIVERRAVANIGRPRARACPVEPIGDASDTGFDKHMIEGSGAWNALCNQIIEADAGKDRFGINLHRVQHCEQQQCFCLAVAVPD